MTFISEFNSLMWGYVLSIILLGTGLIYSVATGFPQLTQFGKIWGSLKANMDGEVVFPASVPYVLPLAARLGRGPLLA